jgi:hypothetical protein
LSFFFRFVEASVCRSMDETMPEGWIVIGFAVLCAVMFSRLSVASLVFAGL